MSNSSSVRFDKEFDDFINKGVNNVNLKRTEINPNHKAITKIGYTRLIEKYFKLKNDRYLELIEIGVENV